MTTQFLTFLVLSRMAEAHGIDAHHVAIELDGAVVRVAVTPGVDAFPDADVNGDAILDRAEVATARNAIRARFETAFHLEDPRGLAPVCEPASISTVGSGEAHVRVSLRCAFRSPPGSLVVRMDALGWLPYTLEAARTRQVGPGRWAPDGDVMGGTIPAGGGVATLLRRDPVAAVDTASRVPPLGTSTLAPLALTTTGLSLAALVATALWAWKRVAGVRRVAQPPGSRLEPSNPQGPPR